MPLSNPFFPKKYDNLIQNTTVVTQETAAIEFSIQDILNRATSERLVLLMPSYNERIRPRLYTWIEDPNYPLEDEDLGASNVFPNRRWILVGQTVPSEATPTEAPEGDTGSTPSTTEESDFEMSAGGWTTSNPGAIEYRLLAANLNPTTGEWFSIDSIKEKAQVPIDSGGQSWTPVIDEQLGYKRIVIEGNKDFEYMHPISESVEFSRLIVMQGKDLNFYPFGEISETNYWIYSKAEMIAAPNEAIEIYGANAHSYSANGPQLTQATNDILVIGLFVHTGQSLTVTWINGHRDQQTTFSMESRDMRGTYVISTTQTTGGFLIEDVIYRGLTDPSQLIADCVLAANHYGADLLE